MVAIKAVTDDNDLMIINRSGITIRTSIEQIRVAGRATQGVRIINLREGDEIASVAVVPATEEEEELDENVVVAEGAEATAEVTAEVTEATAEAATSENEQ